MATKHSIFDEHEVIHQLKHYLPAQAPLKDFVHHNTLHAFQNLNFFKALRTASEMLGYRVSLSLKEFRDLYHSKRIKDEMLEKAIIDFKGTSNLTNWKDKAINKEYHKTELPKIGNLRSNWKRQYKIDLDSMIHPLLFRVLCSYLDQGISIWSFPIRNMSFLESIKELEKNSSASLFRTKRARNLLLNHQLEITDLLKILVGKEEHFEQYLFDQQFAHQGWSGMISVIEDLPETLLDTKLISLRELIIFESLLEIDALDYIYGVDAWIPLSEKLTEPPVNLFSEVPESEISDVMTIWQNAFEWSYYDEVLLGIKSLEAKPEVKSNKSFQAMFCIDDRECSFRRYLEDFDPHCETFGTPGFFGVEFFYQPEGGKFYTKVCPAPVTPKYLVKEYENTQKREKVAHFSKHSQSLHTGWMITQSLGFVSAAKLFFNIFRPTISPAAASSFKHMDKRAQLTIENKSLDDIENGLQIGFTVEEMAVRVEGVLKSTGMVEDFANLVYIIGHGSSSVNNPHYAAYDCGACSGRAGSVNSRVFSYMANHPKVREILATKGIHIPDETQFVGGLHDTTRDEIVFYDKKSLTQVNYESHQKNKLIFFKALDYNSKERSRRFESINTKLSPRKIHEKIRTRSVSLFEPRPELNHATNALCIIGRRELSKGLFLDRRSFMNSYNYKVDPDGKYLLNILKAAAPVCGGINLEYFFSRVDNQKLGAGSKLPHNVMGLFGVANGIDGDFLECQLAHLFAFALILLLVTIERPLPASHFRAAGIEAQLRRLPVADHEAFQVALVPGDNLIVEDFLDGAFGARRLAE
ncbi:MAG: DUF2309 domain-containing protein, partial [Bacteroidetes bacterium]|nr:DUF2309 domain-containing protein [Bacteroidota bacterium]